jgi:hypothetical protein
VPVAFTIAAVERTPLQDAIDGWLVEGPLSVEDLAGRAVRAGFVPAEADDDGFDPEDHIDGLLQRSDAYWLTRSHGDDELVVSARTFTDTGMTFTHRVTAEELEAEALGEMPDLSVVLWESRDGLPLNDGSGRVQVDYGAMAAPRLVGPTDWIEAVQPGDLLAFTRTDGVLSVEVVDEEALGDGAAEVEALRDAAHSWIGDGRGSEELPVVMEALARQPGLFRVPVPPVGELLVEAGLERRGHEWGWAHEEWQTSQERFRDDDTAVRRLFGFDGCCDRAYERVKDAWFGRREAVDGRALAEDLRHGAVAGAFVHTHADAVGAVVSFAGALAETATGRHRGPALALLGLAQLRAGAPESAARSLEAAVRADADLTFAAGMLAGLELDRGNLARAHALALQEGADPRFVRWIEEERSRQAALQPSAGRNDPCPCGSGKKYKRCCAHGGQLPLAQRVPFVLQRLGHFATGPDGHDTMFGLAVSAAGDHEDVVGAIRRFLEDPFLVDVAIHEGGLGETYLDQRGALMADDEVALFTALFEEPRRLWEVTAVAPGESLTLRDTGSGNVVTVVERSGSEGREPGELMLARATAVDGEVMLCGVPLLVPLRERARVLRLLDGWADADTIAMWFGSLFLPPRMANREGEELVLRRTVCEVDDEGVVAAALDEVFERQGDDPVWHETTLVDDHDRVIRGVLRLDGPLLTVESNSEQRQERLLDRLEDLFDYGIVDDDEIGDLDDEGDAGFEPLDLEAMSDEVRALVEQNIAEYEQRWVDESIPALGGLTPRQALDDPTRREDLSALLREMRSHELPDGAVGMSVDRIERLLGIERS